MAYINRAHVRELLGLARASHKPYYDGLRRHGNKRKKRSHPPQIMMATLDDNHKKKTKEAAAAAQQQQRAWRGILDRALIDRNARAADRIEVGDFRSASRHAARIMRRLDALRASGMALPAPQHLPAPLRGFGPFRAYYAAWLLAAAT